MKRDQRSKIKRYTLLSFHLTNEDLELAERNQTDCTLGLALTDDIDKRNTILRDIAQIELNLSSVAPSIN